MFAFAGVESYVDHLFNSEQAVEVIHLISCIVNEGFVKRIVTGTQVISCDRSGQ